MVTGTKAQPLSIRSTGATEGRAPSRVGAVAAFVAVFLGLLSVTGTFTSKPLRPVSYVAALFFAALVLALVAREHRRLARAWWLIAAGVAVWFVAGALVTLQGDYNVTSIPSLAVSITYAVGYLPVVAGVAELADPEMHTRRVSSIADGVLLFLTLYAVLWLLVVEQVVYDSTYGIVDRAFQAFYPAGDLAVLMLAVRVLASRTLRRTVGWLLFLGAVLRAVADVGLLVFYLVKPLGTAPGVYNLCYLVGLAAFAIAGVLALLPGPPPIPAGARTGRWMPVGVALSATLPAVVLISIVWFTERTVSIAPIAMWLFLVAIVYVMRSMAGMREIEIAHQHALWLASHDIQTDMLRRTPFLHEVSEGSMRDRSGTVIVLEVAGTSALADALGHDVVEHMIGVVAQRLHAAAGEGAVTARMSADQFAAFLRSNTLGRGRQVAGALQMSLSEPIVCGDRSVVPEFSIGVAQADGAVIDVLAGVRRATEAMRHARRLGPGHIAVDADLTGTVLASSVQSGAAARTLPTGIG